MRLTDAFPELDRWEKDLFFTRNKSRNSPTGRVFFFFFLKKK